MGPLICASQPPLIGVFLGKVNLQLSGDQCTKRDRIPSPAQFQYFKDLGAGETMGIVFLRLFYNIRERCFYNCQSYA